MLERRVQFGLGAGLTPMIRNLLIANGIVFLLQMFDSQRVLISYFGLHADKVFGQFRFWQLITYAFLHGNFFHIFFNMFALWMFGTEVERNMGSRGFIKFYVLTAVGAGFLQILAHIGSSVPVIGASGAVYGVLVAFAVFFPERVVTLLLFFVLPVQIKAKYLVMFFVGVSLLAGIQSEIFGIADQVAHLAHLGGALVAFLYLRGDLWIGKLVREISWRRQLRQIQQENKRHAEEREIRDKVDKILDRINEVGYDKISREDKNFLKKASDRLSKE